MLFQRYILPLRDFRANESNWINNIQLAAGKTALVVMYEVKYDVDVEK